MSGVLALESRPVDVAVTPDLLRLRPGEETEFVVDIRDDSLREDTSLIIDLYREEDRSHPHGHFGWWRFAMADAVFRGRLAWRAGHLAVEAADWPLEGEWVNPELTLAAGPSLAVHIVVRSNYNSRILLDYEILAHTSDAAAAAQHAVAAAFGAGGDAAGAGFVWPAGVGLRVVAPAIHDVVNPGRMSIAHPLASALADLGLPVTIYSDRAASQLREATRCLARLPADLAEQDIVFYCFEGFDPLLAWLSKLPARKVFFAPGIRLDRNLQVFDAERHAQLDAAMRLALLALRFDKWVTFGDCGIAALCDAFAHSAEFLGSPDWERAEGLSRGDRDDVLGGLASAILASGRRRRGAPISAFAGGDATAASIISALQNLNRRPGNSKPMPISEDWIDAIRCVVEDRTTPLAPFAPAWGNLPADPPAYMPYLLWSGRLMPGERIQEIVTLFSALADAAPELSLVLSGFSPPESYIDYVRHCIRSLRAGLERRIHIRLDVGSSEERGLFCHAEAVIWAGTGGSDTLLRARMAGRRRILIDPDEEALQRFGADLVIVGTVGLEHAGAVLRTLQAPPDPDRWISPSAAAGNAGLESVVWGLLRRSQRSDAS